MEKTTRKIVEIDGKKVSETVDYIIQTIGYIQKVGNSFVIQCLDGKGRGYSSYEQESLERGPCTWSNGEPVYSDPPRPAKIGDWVEIKEEPGGYGCAVTLSYIDPKEVERRYFKDLL